MGLLVEREVVCIVRSARCCVCDDELMCAEPFIYPLGFLHFSPFLGFLLYILRSHSASGSKQNSMSPFFFVTLQNIRYFNAFSGNSYSNSSLR